MTGAGFEGALNCQSLQVGGPLLMRDGQYANEVDLAFAHVGGRLDLYGASLAGLDLSGTSIAGDLALGGGYKPAVWKGKNGEPGALTLHNTHTGNLMDAKDAWPDRGHLHLDGFTFGHLGGFAGETGPEMAARGMEWWDSWARRDPKYNPVIEINREFTEFFNDPERERLNWWQSILFSALGIVGFVLGAILLTAVSGLTQSP